MGLQLRDDIGVHRGRLRSSDAPSVTATHQHEYGNRLLFRDDLSTLTGEAADRIGYAQGSVVSVRMSSRSSSNA